MLSDDVVKHLSAPSTTFSREAKRILIIEAMLMISSLMSSTSTTMFERC